MSPSPVIVRTRYLFRNKPNRLRIPENVATRAAAYNFKNSLENSPANSLVALFTRYFLSDAYGERLSIKLVEPKTSDDLITVCARVFCGTFLW